MTRVCRSLTRTTAICGLVLMLIKSVCADAMPQQLTDERDYQIASQPLADALKAFSTVNGLQLFYPADLVEGQVAPALTGRFTAQQGLKRLLQNTQLIYRVKNSGTITLERRSETTLDADTLISASDHFQFAAAEPEEEPYTGPVEQIDMTVQGMEVGYNALNASTATKTDTPIMETPLNIQVISKQVLDDQQIINLEDSLKNVSGVTSSSGDTVNLGFSGITQNITIRGFASETFLRNGFRLQQGAGLREMANVESVELLKGSAAILYGLVEPGGIVNVTTKKPLATPYYAVQQQFGSYDLYRTTIDATGPLTDDDTLLYRANLSYQNNNSFRDFVEGEKVFFAPVLQWNISDQTRAMLELEYNHNDQTVDIPYIPVINGEFLDIPRSRSYIEPMSNGVNDTIFVGLNWSHDFNEDWTIKHNFAFNQSSNDISAIFPASLFLTLFDPNLINDPQLIPRGWSVADREDTTYSTNLDLTGHFETFGLKHTLLLGGDYYRIDNSYHIRTSGAFSQIDTFNPIHPGITPPAFTTPLSREAFNRIKTDQFGLYLQDQIELPYHLFVTGGFRYQYLHQSTDFTVVGRNPFSPPSLTADEVTPRVGVLWQAQDWLSIYGNYTESFGANNTNLAIGPGKAAPPTTSQQWEVGVKTEFFDGRLRATLAYFDLTKQNIVTADPTRPNSNFGILTGEVNSYGPELDIQGEILPGWNVIGTYSYIDARTTKNALPPSGFFAQPAGSRFWGVPRNTASVWSTYEFQDETLRGLMLGGGVTLRDSQVIANTSQSIPGYGVVDLLASYTLKVGKSKVTAQFNVNNLLDKTYLTGATVPGFPVANASGTEFDSGYVNYGQPRTFMGSIKVEF